MAGIPQIFYLQANKDLRLVVESSEVSIELLEGSAEIFGIEMIIKRMYTLSSSFAVGTRHGCTLKLEGDVTKAYNVTQNNVISNMHASLENHRSMAERNGTKGPITLIAGPTDVGKSTLTRSLLNYAARSGRKPLYVDLDVGQSSISIPGTLGILPIDRPGDITTGFHESNLSVYFFGYKSPGFNILLYFLLIDKLGRTLHSRLSNSTTTSHSGAIIDTCGWVNGQGYKSILVAARSFEINLLIVLSDKKLYSQLKYDLPSNVEIQFISKLEGVVERNKSARISRRNSLICEYFYGSPQCCLKPYIIEVRFSNINVFRVTSSTSKVQIDSLSEAHNDISLIPVPISPEFLNHILAVSHADDIEDVMLTCVLGFICVKSVDMDHEVLTVLSPQPGPLPKNILLMGDIQFDLNES